MKKTSFIKVKALNGREQDGTVSIPIYEYNNLIERLEKAQKQLAEYETLPPLKTAEERLFKEVRSYLHSVANTIRSNPSFLGGRYIADELEKQAKYAPERLMKQLTKKY